MSTGRRTSKRPRGESEPSTDLCTLPGDQSNAGQDASSTQPLRKRRKASDTDACPRVEQSANKLDVLRRKAKSVKRALDEARRKFLADRKNEELRLEFQRMMKEGKAANLALKRARSAICPEEAQPRKSLPSINDNSNQVNSKEALKLQMEAVLKRAAEDERKYGKRFELFGDRECSFCNKEGHTPDRCPLKTMAPHLQYGDPGVGGNNMSGCDWDKTENANWDRRH